MPELDATPVDGDRIAKLYYLVAKIAAGRVTDKKFDETIRTLTAAIATNTERIELLERTVAFIEEKSGLEKLEK